MILPCMLFDKKSARSILWIIIATYLIFSLFIWWENEDYLIHFVKIWEDYLDGEITYVYPIGFSIFFAPLYDIWFKLPKLVFIVSFLIASYQFYLYIFNNEKYKSVSQKKKFWAFSHPENMVRHSAGIHWPVPLQEKH